MKHLKCVIFASAVCVMLQQASVFADGAKVVFSGKIQNADSGKYLAAAVMSKDSDLINPAFSDIKWLDQTKIGEDGSYSISVPYSLISGENELRSTYSIVPTEYVNEASGLDTNDGSKTAPYKTLKKALENAAENSRIVVTDTVTVPKNMAWATEKTVTVTGKDPISGQITGTLDLTQTVSLVITAPATIENMTIETLSGSSVNKVFACGNKLVMGEGLTIANPIEIFGGSPINNTVTSTDLTLKSGTYKRIYGGGEQSEVTGDTHIKIGNINTQYSADDGDAKYYDSRVFGGGKYAGAKVGGNSYIDMTGGTLAYVIGGGIASEMTGSSYINISGGNVMNVYGAIIGTGSAFAGDTHINMTGGTVEGVFGASESNSYTGNTYVTVTGGRVLRRIYGGSYNNYKLSGWTSDCAVAGTTNVVIGKDAELFKDDSGKAFKSDDNMGIFGGSRSAANHAEEDAVIIFLEGAYEKHGGKVGDISGWSNIMLSNHDHIVYCGSGGTLGADKGKNIKLIPEPGMKAVIDNADILSGRYTLEKELTEVTFAGGYTVDGESYTKNETGISASGKLTVNAEVSDSDKIYAAVYTADKRLINVNSVKVSGSGDYIVGVDFPDGENSLMVKLFVWNSGQMAPLSGFYTLSEK